MRFALIFASFLLPACSDDDSAAPSSEAGAADTSVTGCDYECFPSNRCSAGVVTFGTGSQRTCGSCESATYTCTKGCRLDDAGFVGFAQPQLLCEESRPKVVGDPCEAPEDCTPVADDAGGIGAALYCYGGKCSPAADAADDG